jgi:hypothetical protein
MFGIEPTAEAIHNPFGVEPMVVERLPRVAAARQPWAILFKPFGLPASSAGGLLASGLSCLRSAGLPPLRPFELLARIRPFTVFICVHLWFSFLSVSNHGNQTEYS